MVISFNEKKINFGKICEKSKILLLSVWTLKTIHKVLKYFDAVDKSIYFKYRTFHSAFLFLNHLMVALNHGLKIQIYYYHHFFGKKYSSIQWQINWYHNKTNYTNLSNWWGSNFNFCCAYHTIIMSDVFFS